MKPIRPTKSWIPLLTRMKHPTKKNLLTLVKWFFQPIAIRYLAWALALGAPLAVNAGDAGQTFATPEEAVSALTTAIAANDTNALRVIFGPAVAEIENPDRVQAAYDLTAFGAALQKGTRIARESNSRCILEVGDQFWPFPIPLTRQEGRWHYDPRAGREEILNRRIGRNELLTLRTVRAYVEAQREYAAQDRDGDEVLEFAQKLISTPGTKDGLYWSLDLDGQISPLGPLVGQAQNEGYGEKPAQEGAAPQPFHGYFFKVLTRQGNHAPSGKYKYIINGNMIGGFALVAWPASYGESGIMTFIVNQQGRVYQSDLGPETAKIVRKMKEYGPDGKWVLSPD